ncbi:MAG: hypothetical protein FWC89_04990 [Defluviitaleaceae bacterium]|nr:hypothetical protein [Defluviitaleaceae bacterium]
MTNTYKYQPQDFTRILSLSEDLAEFYKCYEDCQKDNTQSKRFAFERAGDAIGFTIKHRMVEGSITPPFADELNEYLGGLLHD